MLTCSIGIMAYNEAANIGALLEALLNQEVSVCSVKDICVVASGCTDGTKDIVGEYMHRDSRIRLLVQKTREGKAAAINLYLSRVDADICILESGDTIPETETIDRLVSPFLDPSVGMTGARPVPVNRPDTFMGFTVNLLWNLHHRISLEHPKMGELVAFRNVVRQIPADTAVDEASIEAIIMAKGLRLKYIGEAVVRNKGPDNIRDLLGQRRRISAGHLYVKQTQGHAVSTSSWSHVLGPLLREMGWGPKAIVWTAGAAGIELLGRVLGSYDYRIRKKNPVVWEIAASTKRLKGSQ